VSPDGHRLAYASDETGRYEVYVRAFSPEAGVGQPVEVSTDGGFAPRWRGDGRELYFVSAPISAADGRLMAVSVKTEGATLAPGTPAPLFETHMMPGGTTHEFDVTPDGRRFLVAAATRDPRTTGMNLVFDWCAGLRR
jgi:eukaryotic-like serine/threonine-protein kinase